MSKLTYWYCECLVDHSAYNLRAKTKKEVLKMKESRPDGRYGEPKKNVINYRDAFDLMDICLNEDRGYE